MAALTLKLPASPVEHSVAARLLVFVAFCIAAAGVIGYGQDVLVPVLGVMVAAIGHVVSYRDRAQRRSFWQQALLAALVFVAFFYFIADSSFALLGGAMPQANFAILLVAITSFDLKSRRNCYSSLWISLAVLYLAAVYAWDYLFAVVVAGWVLCLAGFWWSSHLGRMGAALAGPVRPIATGLVASLLLGALIFVAVPQPAGGVSPLVFSLPNFTGFRGDMETAALPLVDVSGSPAGASSSLDLHYRGRLGDAPVMYVRTGAPAYWRGLVFDTYEGGVWTASDRDYRQVQPYVTQRQLPPPPPHTLGTFSQVFRVARTLPGVISAAYPMQSLYAPVAALREDAYGTFHTPDILHPGQTYSVVSFLPDLSAQELRSDHAWAYQGMLTNPAYLDISSLSEQGRKLAIDIGAVNGNDFDTVMSIVKYLQTNYQYSLDVPRVPQGRDPVDYFLFDNKTGYCEQFATAAALMLRTFGFPTRLVTGYATGDYNATLNESVVREHDAHAWVEVYFRKHGWVPVDPTPGVDPLAWARMPRHWAAGGMAQLLPHLTIGAPPVALGSVGALALIPAAIGVAVVLFAAFVWIRRRRWFSRTKVAPGESELLRLYERLQRKLRRRRAPPETPSEYLAQEERPAALHALLEDVTQAVNEGAYAGRWPDPARVREMADRLS